MNKRVVRPARFVEQKSKTPIPVDGLKVGMFVSELDRPWTETPFILQGFEIRSVEDIEEIAAHCDYVYVDNAEHVFLAPVERSTDGGKAAKKRTFVNKTSNKQEKSRATAALSNARKLTSSFMDDVRLGKSIDVKQIKATVSECVQSILRNPDAMLWMSKIKDKDSYTSQHSLNVCILAINFGRHLGAPEDDLGKLGVSALMHDIGKMRIPTDILHKAGPLTAEEQATYEKHPVYGRDILLQQDGLYHGAVDVAYAHHEHIDGTGYPRQIKAAGISDFTRIISICDQYDALTSDRPSSAGKSSRAALRYLYDNRGKKFDERLVHHFIECIGLYPAGSVVELKNGCIGLVVGTNYRHRHLPKVLVLTNEEKQKQSERIINLGKLVDNPDSNLLIARVLPNGSHGIRLEEYIEKGLMLD